MNQSLEHQRSSTEELVAILGDVNLLLSAAEESALLHSRPSASANSDAFKSVQNFLAYLGIRRTDIRDLQRKLHRLGLSSLGRIETHAVDCLASVAAILAQLSGNQLPAISAPRLSYDEGEQLLSRRSHQLLGPRPTHSSTRIMVTLPAEVASHTDLARELIASGMQIARINCAHDTPLIWQAMIEQVRRAAREMQRHLVIACDLPGPKVRTCTMEVGPGVVRWHAFKDIYGKVIAPARIWISGGIPAPEFAHAELPVTAEFAAQLAPGDQIHFRDHQGRIRWIDVVSTAPGGAWGEAARGAFMVAGIELRAKRGGAEMRQSGWVRELPPMPREIILKPGDALDLTPASIAGRPVQRDASGAVVAPAHIGCSLPEVFRDARVGHRIFLDDGKIAGTIESVDPQCVRMRVTWTRGANARLGEDKGINLPDSDLQLSGLTQADLDVLDFVDEHRDAVDGVNLSFVRDCKDVAALYDELDRRHAANLGVILKIETATAFQNLPEIVPFALRRNKVGVMIARGDLGVEVGFERMAELQEEIGSLCAAAHLPVIWATQVLETLAKKGMPSRAEVSDVVLAARTQCVMLNKGPHLPAAIRFLADVLERMEGHQDKHFRLMRALRVAGNSA